MEKKPSSQFDLVKRGYDPSQVDSYITYLLDKLAQHKLTEQAEHGLHDPDNAARRLLAAAQEAADKLLNDAKEEAEAFIQGELQDHREQYSDKAVQYDAAIAELAAKTEAAEKSKQELEEELNEFVQKAKEGLKASSLSLSDLESLIQALGNFTFDLEVVDSQTMLEHTGMQAPSGESEIQESNPILKDSPVSTAYETPMTPAPISTPVKQEAKIEQKPKSSLDPLIQNSIPETEAQERNSDPSLQNAEKGKSTLTPEEQKWAEEISDSSTEEFSSLIFKETNSQSESSATFFDFKEEG